MISSFSGANKVDGVPFEVVEDQLLREPAVDFWVDVVAEPGVRRWRKVTDEVGVGRAADDDAGMSMASEHHTQPAGVEVESVCLG